MEEEIAHRPEAEGYSPEATQSFDFQSSTRVVFGENTLDQLGNLTKELGERTGSCRH